MKARGPLSNHSALPSTFVNRHAAARRPASVQPGAVSLYRSLAPSAVRPLSIRASSTRGPKEFFITKWLAGLNGIASRNPLVLTVTNLVVVSTILFETFHSMVPAGQFLHDLLFSFKHAWQFVATPILAFVATGLFSANFVRAFPRAQSGARTVELTEADLAPTRIEPESVRRRNAENGTPLAFATHMAERHKGFSVTVSAWNWLFLSIPLLNWVPIKWFGTTTLVGAALANLIGLVPLSHSVYLYLLMFPILTANRIIHELFLSDGKNGRPPGYSSLSNTFWEFGNRRPVIAAAVVGLGALALGVSASGILSLGMGAGGAILATAIYCAIYTALGMAARRNPQALPPLSPLGQIFEFALNRPRAATLGIIGITWLVGNPVLNVAVRLFTGHSLNVMGSGLADFYQFGTFGPWIFLMLLSAGAQLIAARGSRLLPIRAFLTKTDPRLPQETAPAHRVRPLTRDLWEWSMEAGRAGGLPVLGTATLVNLHAAMRFFGDSGLPGFLATLASADPTGIVDTLIFIILSLYPAVVFGYAKRYGKQRPDPRIYAREHVPNIGSNAVWEPRKADTAETPEAAAPPPAADTASEPPPAKA